MRISLSSVFISSKMRQRHNETKYGCEYYRIQLSLAEFIKGDETPQSMYGFQSLST